MFKKKNFATHINFALSKKFILQLFSHIFFSCLIRVLFSNYHDFLKISKEVEVNFQENILFL